MNDQSWYSGKDYQRDATETNRFRRKQMKRQLIRNFIIGIGILIVVAVLSFALVEKVKNY